MIRLRPDIQIEVLGDDAAVVDLASNQLFRLNTVGAFLAHHLQSQTDVATLVAAVVNAFDVSTDAAHRDVGEFVAELTRLGWIETT